MTPLIAGIALFSGGFTAIDGTRHALADPKPAVLIFVMTECPIVRGYVPELKRLAAVKGTRIFLVHVDPATTANDAKAFGKEYGLAYRAVLDKDHALVKRFKIEAVPTAVVLDAQGRAAYVGRIDDRYPSLGVQRKPRSRDLRDALDTVIAGRTIARRLPAIGCAVPDL
ncbi:redoxin domain-containing protein [bacterium]|nr:MAG: redoxin domain-containing protein [bacterium]